MVTEILNSENTQNNNSINEHIFNFINLQLPVKSLPITTDVMSSNAVHGEMYTILHSVIKFVSYLRQIGVFFPGTPVSFTNKTDHHNITEILLKVAYNTIKPNQANQFYQFKHILFVNKIDKMDQMQVKPKKL